jgi:hypothetical protein
MAVDNGIGKRVSTLSNSNYAKLAIKHDANVKSYIDGLTKVMIRDKQFRQIHKLAEDKLIVLNPSLHRWMF